MKLLPILFSLSLGACAGVHESDWNYSDSEWKSLSEVIQHSQAGPEVHRVHHHYPRPAALGNKHEDRK